MRKGWVVALRIFDEIAGFGRGGGWYLGVGWTRFWRLGCGVLEWPRMRVYSEHCNVCCQGLSRRAADVAGESVVSH